MEYQVFKTQFLEEIQKIVPPGMEAALEKIPKNNGLSSEGILFSQKDLSVAPIIYLDGYYRDFERGTPMRQLADNMLEVCREYRAPDFVEGDFFRSYKKICGNIYYKLINYERNKELLADLPHERFLDLAVVFYYRVQHASIQIRRSHLEMWQITEETLKKNARERTPKALPPRLMTMNDLIATDLPKDMPEKLVCQYARENPMYILTNCDKYMGAAAILYPGVLHHISEILGGRIYILPSSIHECLLLPEDEGYTKEGLSRMVYEVNREAVQETEILSDQAYVYLAREDRIFL